MYRSKRLFSKSSSKRTLLLVNRIERFLPAKKLVHLEMAIGEPLLQLQNTHELKDKMGKASSRVEKYIQFLSDFRLFSWNPFEIRCSFPIFR